MLPSAGQAMSASFLSYGTLDNTVRIAAIRARRLSSVLITYHGEWIE